MEKCGLCQVNEANKKGTHVIPYFLLKSMLLSAGSKRAEGKEFTFQISSHDTDFHVGRGVSAAEIDDLVGKGQDADELAAKTDPHIVDNVWCFKCERLFSGIEEYYSKRAQFVESEELLENTCESSLAFLFWSSVFWRISITGYGDSNFLKQGDLEYLRGFLIRWLPIISKRDSGSISRLEMWVKESPMKYSLFVCPSEDTVGIVGVESNL